LRGGGWWYLSFCLRGTPQAAPRLREGVIQAVKNRGQPLLCSRACALPTP